MAYNSTVNSPYLAFSSIKGSKLHGIVKNPDFNVDVTGPIGRSNYVGNRTGYSAIVLVAVSITRGPPKTPSSECGPVC